MNCRYCGGLLVQTSGPDLCMNLQCPGPVVQQPTEADALREELATHLRVHLGVVNDNIALRAEVAALTEKLRDGKSHICAIPHEHRGCAFCQRDEAREEVAELKAELTELRALRDRLVAFKHSGIIQRDEFLAIIERAQELAQ